MAEAPSGSGPDDRHPRVATAGGPLRAARRTDAAAESGAGAVELSPWAEVLGWSGVAGLIYLLICAVSGSGFAGLGSDAAHTMFAFAANPWVGLSVGVLGTVLIQWSTTTTPIAVTAVGSGALPSRARSPSSWAPTPLPVWCAENLARVASERRWVLGVYLGTVFVALPPW